MELLAIVPVHHAAKLKTLFILSKLQTSMPGIGPFRAYSILAYRRNGAPRLLHPLAVAGVSIEP
jgi:hypothetical protein